MIADRGTELSAHLTAATYRWLVFVGAGVGAALAANVQPRGLAFREHARSYHEGGFTVEPEGKGRFTFHRPDGTAFPRSPTLPERPPDGIKDLNREAGLHIDHRTGDTRWTGEQIDYHDAVFLLFQADGRL